MTKKAYWVIASALIVAMIWDSQIALFLLIIGLLWIIFDGK